MILKRPYAFLIKHFRLIHLIITTILAYLLIQNRNLYTFLGRCISDVVNKYDANLYIHYGILLLFILAIGLFYVIYWLLKYKNKPKNIYIFSMVCYAIVGIVIFLTYNYINGFNTNVIDSKTIRLYRDILFITMLIQAYVVIVMLIRGLGFDIKKFNFSSDFQELNIKAEDNEEVEVNLGIDTTNIMRNVRKQKREFGYFFQEFKIYIIAIIIIILIFLGFKGYNYFEEKLKVYKQNDLVGSHNFITITDSYYSISDNQNYVIIKFNIYKNGKNEKININNLLLQIGKNKYTPDKTICSRFKSLGTCYKQQYITNNVNSYIVVYPVTDLNIEKSYIIYNETYDNNYKIKLSMNNY